MTARGGISDENRDFMDVRRWLDCWEWKGNIGAEFDIEIGGTLDGLRVTLVGNEVDGTVSTFCSSAASLREIFEGEEGMLDESPGLC